MTQQPDDMVEQKPAWWMQRYIETQAATITELRQRVAELEGERDSYKAALGDVSNPLRYLERQAEEAGRSLGPMAYTIANDLPFVQSIARTALERRGSE